MSPVRKERYHKAENPNFFRFLRAFTYAVRLSVQRRSSLCGGDMSDSVLCVHNVIKLNIHSQRKINSTVTSSEALPVLRFQHKIC